MFPCKTFVILYLVLRSTNAAQLTSPCPNIFMYEEPEWDRWYGIVTFSSNIELVGLNYRIQLDRPAHLLVSWDGEVRSEDNMNFSVLDPNHFQRAGEVVKTRIMVKFNPIGTIPNIVKIIINGNTMCSNKANNSPVTLASGTGHRPDLSFNEEDTVSEYSNRPNNQNSNSGYGNANRPSYNEPSYNSGGSSNHQTSASNPSYSGGGSNYGNTNSEGYNTPNHPNTASNNNPNYNNPQNNYVPSENVIYPSNHQSNSGFSNSQSQWSENPQNSFGNNRNNSGFGTNTGPLVTALTLPVNNTQNKNNIDTIVQIIKNQLEQQQGNSHSNNTVIVALVSPVNSNAALTNYNEPVNRDSTDRETSTHRTSTTNAPSSSSVATKTRSTTSTSVVKSSNTRNKD